MTVISIGQPLTGNEEESARLSQIRSGMPAQGPAAAMYEEKCVHYCDVKQAIAVNRGTAVHYASLACARIKTGDDVLFLPVCLNVTQAMLEKICTAINGVC